MVAALGPAKPWGNPVSLVLVTLRRRWGKFNAGETCGVDPKVHELLLAHGFLDGREPPMPDQLVDPLVEVVNDTPEAAERRRKRWHEDRQQKRSVRKGA